jgi:hypothetical protein
MKTDTEIRTTGLQLLVKGLGRVEAERFISLILREPFDYTKWQRDLWKDKTVQDLSTEAMRLRLESE